MHEGSIRIRVNRIVVHTCISQESGINQHK
uniref:Uncharacterized protein n=1 Tax=Arundo donax TaxID=35708 RepID=A0A0A9GQ41_ARUDO